MTLVNLVSWSSFVSRVCIVADLRRLMMRDRVKAVQESCTIQLYGLESSYSQVVSSVARAKPVQWYRLWECVKTDVR